MSLRQGTRCVSEKADFTVIDILFLLWGFMSEWRSLFTPSFKSLLPNMHRAPWDLLSSCFFSTEVSEGVVGSEFMPQRGMVPASRK